MKVLENNYEKSTGRNAVRKIVCDHCRSVLEIDESDVEYGAYGLPQITCPCCGKMIDDTGDIPAETLTTENLIFPKHFHHVSKESGAADCFERNVLKTIREQVDFFTTPSRRILLWWVDHWKSDVYRSKVRWRRTICCVSVKRLLRNSHTF